MINSYSDLYMVQSTYILGKTFEVIHLITELFCYIPFLYLLNMAHPYSNQEHASSGWYFIKTFANM